MSVGPDTTGWLDEDDLSILGRLEGFDNDDFDDDDLSKCPPPPPLTREGGELGKGGGEREDSLLDDSFTGSWSFDLFRPARLKILGPVRLFFRDTLGLSLGGEFDVQRSAVSMWFSFNPPIDTSLSSTMFSMEFESFLLFFTFLSSFFLALFCLKAWKCDENDEWWEGLCCSTSRASICSNVWVGESTGVFWEYRTDDEWWFGRSCTPLFLRLLCKAEFLAGSIASSSDSLSLNFITLTAKRSGFEDDRIIFLFFLRSLFSLTALGEASSGLKCGELRVLATGDRFFGLGCLAVVIAESALGGWSLEPLSRLLKSLSRDGYSTEKSTLIKSYQNCKVLACDQRYTYTQSVLNQMYSQCLARVVLPKWAMGWLPLRFGMINSTFMYSRSINNRLTGDFTFYSLNAVNTRSNTQMTLWISQPYSPSEHMTSCCEEVSRCWRASYGDACLTSSPGSRPCNRSKSTEDTHTHIHAPSQYLNHGRCYALLIFIRQCRAMSLIIKI